MRTKFHTGILLSAGFVSSIISAVFMSSTLYALAPAGWMAVIALFMGLILEVFKSGFSRMASDFYVSRRYVGFTISAAAVVVALCFAVWAGQERFIHALVADHQESAGLQVRLGQIHQLLESNGSELQALDSQASPQADTAALKKRVDDLYAQSKSMRERGGWSKAEQMEASIAPLRLEIEQRERDAITGRDKRVSEIREQNESLRAEQVAIEGRTGKLVTTDLSTAGLILKAVIVLLETAPIFLFFMSGLKQPGFNPALNPLENRASQPSESDERDSILASLRVAVGSKTDSILEQGQSSGVAFSQSAAAASTVDAGIAHPKLSQGIEYVTGLEPGTKISTQEFKIAVCVGSDHVAKILTQIAADTGLVAKSGRSWVRV